MDYKQTCPTLLPKQTWSLSSKAICHTDFLRKIVQNKRSSMPLLEGCAEMWELCGKLCPNTHCRQQYSENEPVPWHRTIEKRHVINSSGLWKQYCEQHLHVSGGLVPHRSRGLDLQRAVANGHTSTHSLLMSTFHPPFKCVFSETGVRTHGTPLGVSSGSLVVSDIFLYCFNYAYCNQPTRPNKGHASMKNGFTVKIVSDFFVNRTV